MNDFDDVIQHGPGQTGIAADEQRLRHDFISALQFAHHAEGVGTVLLQLHKNWLAHEVPAKEHPILGTTRLIDHLTRQIPIRVNGPPGFVRSMNPNHEQTV